MIVERDDRLDGVFRIDEREEAIIRANEEAAIDAQRQGSARAADPRVHHAEEDRADREVAPAREEHPCPRCDVLRWDLVREVHERHPRGDTKDYALHDADISIGEAEVGQQRDCRCARHASRLIHAISRQSKRTTPALRSVTTRVTSSLT